MQMPEFLKNFRLPEMAEMREYLQNMSPNTVMGMGAFAALSTFWYATRPKALEPPCDLWQQSVEVEVSVPRREEPCHPSLSVATHSLASV